VYSLELKGKRGVLPSFAETVAVVDAMRASEMGILLSVKELEKIDTIRDLTWSPRTVIPNPIYEQEWVGWDKHSGNADFDTSIKWFGSRSLHFPFDGIVSNVRLFLSVPVDVDALDSLKFQLYSHDASVDLIRVTVYYTDGTSSIDVFQVTVADTWEEKTCTLTAGKKIERLTLYHMKTYKECWIDGWKTVI